MKTSFSSSYNRHLINRKIPVNNLLSFLSHFRRYALYNQSNLLGYQSINHLNNPRLNVKMTKHNLHHFSMIPIC